MKTPSKFIEGIASLILTLFVFADQAALAQIDLTTNQTAAWFQITNIPETGTFWSWQLQSNFPPSPIDPWPELPVYQLQIADTTNVFGQYIYDDRTFVYSNWVPELSHKPTRNDRQADAATKDVPAPGGGGGGGGPADTWDGVTNRSNYTTNSATAYNLYTNFWLAISNDSTNAYVTVESTLSNLTYEIFTNDDLTQTNGWGLWVTLLATNNVTPAPPLALGSNQLFFEGLLAGTTTTNGLADWWCMQYFGTLNVDPYADPDGDGLCNWDEFMLGTNPTNANSISSSHNDAQALFLAYTNDSMCHYQLAVSNGPDTNTLLVTMWPTVVGTNYQIYSKDYGTSGSAWRVEVSFVGTNTVTTVEVSINGRDLGLIGGYAEDDDGDGLPTGYEVLATLTDPFLPDTGHTGISDGFKDPDGDGYVNIAEYQNGTDPRVFNAPPAPTGITVVRNSDGSTTISWQPSSGSPTGYEIVRTTSSGTTDFTVGSTVFSYHDTSLSSGQNAGYQVQALYSTLNSVLSASYDNLYSPALNIDPIIVNGSSNRLYLVVPNVPTEVTNLLVFRTVFTNEYPFDPERWDQSYQALTPLTTNGSFSIAVTSLSNGIIQITDGQAPLFGSYDFTVQPQGTNGTYGATVDCWGPNVGLAQWPSYLSQPGLIPFVDGTPQLKENLSFHLRAGNEWGPFGYTPTNSYPNYYNDDPDYVFASYYDQWKGLDQLMPFEDNYGYRNFVFLPSATDGFPSTGMVWPVYPPYDGVANLAIPYNITYTFPAYSYVTSSNLAAIPLQLSDTPSQWIFDPFDFANAVDSGDPTPGLYDNGSGMACMTNGAPNCYGLPFVSIQWQTGSSPAGFTTLTPGNCAAEGSGYLYLGVQSPVLQTVGYYFARYGEFDTEGHYEPGLGMDAVPGDRLWAYPTPIFEATNTTPLMIMSLGSQQKIAGYAKQAVANGFSDIYAYLGQYFTNAYVLNDGTLTTNTGGIVSEYGDFYASAAGQVALLTKPDPDQGNMQGQCLVNVIALQTDVNRDGALDPTVTGGDFTTTNHPFRFWVNDDNDSGDDSGNGIPGQVGNQADGQKYSTGAESGGSAYGPVYQVQGTRDLVDYFPVYVNARTVAQTWLTNAQYTNLEFRLSQADGALRFVYTAMTPTNFMDYLLNTNVAFSLSNAITTTITPSGVYLTNTFLAQMATNNQGVIIVEAWEPTVQPLVLDILQNGNILAETKLQLNITGVEQMYRQKDLTAVVPPYVTDGIPDRLVASDVPNEPDANDKNFVFLHGYSVNSDDARGNFSDVFKRLYWSGSHAKFYGVTWRSYTSQGSIFIKPRLTPNYHTNVYNAFLTASNLASFLSTLPGTNIVAAHSLGNMLALSALSDWNAPMAQYYMIDAAVPMEAVQGSASQSPDMIYSDWVPYQNRLFSDEWYGLFATGDARTGLTWSNRLANFGAAEVYNFYSSGEEVLRDYPSDPPGDALGAFPALIWSAIQNATGSYVWVWQEKGKGRGTTDSQIGSTHGGWLFNDPVYGTNDGSSYTHMSPAAASALTSTQLAAFPFFDLSSQIGDLDDFTADLALTGSGGSAYAAANRNRILSDSIAALTLPVGANPVPGSGIVALNLNMQTIENGWPQNRLATTESNNWHHSDFRQLAYTFTYKLYTNFVSIGNLK